MDLTPQQRTNKGKQADHVLQSKLREDKQRVELFNELEDAKQLWQTAQAKLNHMVEEDQIDIAIYALQAAESRYNMLIKKAKELNLNILIDGMGGDIDHDE